MTIPVWVLLGFAAWTLVTLAIVATGVQATALDVLALVVIGARIPHTLVHVLFEQTNVVVSFRSGLFHVQLISMVTMIVVVAAEAMP